MSWFKQAGSTRACGGSISRLPRGKSQDAKKSRSKQPLKVWQVLPQLAFHLLQKEAWHDKGNLRAHR